MEKFPEKTADDIGYTFAKAIISAIPVAGGSISALLEPVFEAPISKRKEEWLKELADTVKQLVKKVDELNLEDLSKNELFITSVLEASQIAFRTHQKEKLDALKSAIFNTVYEDSLNENKKLIFIKLIGDLTPLHLEVLSFLSHDESYHYSLVKEKRPSNSMMVSTTYYPHLSQVWDKVNPDKRADDDLILLILKELHQKGFTYEENMHGGLGKKTTKLGDEFLKFIQES